MKIFFSEYRQEYETYTFGYTVYAHREDFAETEAIYSYGFLPYSDDLRLPPHIFYKARSLRIDLEAFSNTSENRRVNRKVDPLVHRIEMSKREVFDASNADFRAFCLKFADARFSSDNFSPERLDYILHPDWCTHIFSFLDEGKQPLGYVLAQVTDQSFHYWFSFYDLDKGGEVPLGKWMMWRLIHWARRWGKSHIYLGTCYGAGSLYKVRDFKGVEFHDGNSWCADIEVLKEHAKSDDQHVDRDKFKLLSNPGSYLDQL